MAAFRKDHAPTISDTFLPPRVGRLPARPSLSVIARLPVDKGVPALLYAFLCYNDEAAISSWSKEEEAAVMTSLGTVTEKLTKEGRLGPVARLVPTTAATTLRKDRDPPLVIDGPFAETKEQLLGFFVIDCRSLEHALETARELGQANPGGSYEIRPLLGFWPGSAKPETAKPESAKPESGKPEGGKS
jgi:hypothetical protein